MADKPILPRCYECGERVKLQEPLYSGDRLYLYCDNYTKHYREKNLYWDLYVDRYKEKIWRQYLSKRNFGHIATS